MGGGASDHDTHPLLPSDGPTCKVTHPPLKLTSSCHVRGWHSLVYRHPSCMGQVYQPHPTHAHLHRR